METLKTLGVMLGSCLIALVLAALYLEPVPPQIENVSLPETPGLDTLEALVGPPATTKPRVECLACHSSAERFR